MDVSTKVPLELVLTVVRCRLSRVAWLIELSRQALRNCYVDTERKEFSERKERDGDSSVIADRLHS